MRRCYVLRIRVLARLSRLRSRPSCPNRSFARLATSFSSSRPPHGEQLMRSRISANHNRLIRQRLLIDPPRMCRAIMHGPEHAMECQDTPPPPGMRMQLNGPRKLC